MKHTSRRKSARRKYKRLVAALAGAAVVTSAMLPGLPLSKVHAAENTAITAPAPAAGASPVTAPDKETQPAEQTNTARESTKDTTKNRDTERTERDTERNREQKQQHTASSPVAAVKAAAATHGFDTRHDSFSLEWNSASEAVVMVRQDNGKAFKVRLSKDGDTWKITSVTKIVTGGHSDGVVRLGDPVDVVRDNASTFGFDAADDTFTLLSMAGSKAVVQVKTSGQTFKVDLERSNGKWVITTIRGIGNGKYPATYRPASLFGYRTLGAATGPVVTITERTLYNNDAFADWSWRQGSYPSDMRTGVLLAEPKPAAELPGVIVDKVDSIDFGRQFVLYAHLGSVSDRGYGIGIERVVQTGNDLTVTIRTKSPLENRRLAPTKTNDVIPIDRLALNFDDPIHIKFVDQTGKTLNTYTIVKK